MVVVADGFGDMSVSTTKTYDCPVTATTTMQSAPAPRSATWRIILRAKKDIMKTFSAPALALCQPILWWSTLALFVLFSSQAKADRLPAVVQSSAWCLGALLISGERNLPEPESRGLTGQQIVNYYGSIIFDYQNTFELHELGERAGNYYANIPAEELLMVSQGCIDHVAYSLGIRW